VAHIEGVAEGPEGSGERVRAALSDAEPVADGRAEAVPPSRSAGNSSAPAPHSRRCAATAASSAAPKCALPSGTGHVARFVGRPALPGGRRVSS
jgi:hypothetical protein